VHGSGLTYRPRVATLSIEPNDRITFKVLHEDPDLLVIVKPPGVVTTPGKAHLDDSLLNGLFVKYGNKLQKLGRHRDFGLLHRLDRDTSGLVLVALSATAYDALRVAFETRAVGKYYWAVVAGVMNKPTGVIRRPLGEYEGKAGNDPRIKKLARVSSGGKPAVTAYRVLAASASASLLECRPVTGRLHQVRVHLESIGAPILGDEFYGPSSVRLAATRLALHAHRLIIKHPITGERLDVRAGWPADLRGLLRRLKLPRPDLPPPQGIQGQHEVDGEAVGDQEAGVGENPV